MGSFIKKLYQPKYMVKDSLKLGEMPSTIDGYSIAFATAWAAIIETFLVALVGVADTIMVSVIGEHAIAIVGVTNQPRYLAQTMIFALNIAITAICARRKGERDQEGSVNALKQGIVLSAFLSVAISLLFYPFADDLIRFMGAEEAIIPTSADYLRILLIGLPFSNVSLSISAAQRGIGETKASMRINLVANIINIIFNFLLINGIWLFPRLEVRGAGIATSIGWTIGFVVAIASISSKNQFLCVRDTGSWKLDKDTLKSFKAIGAGAFLEQACMRLGFMTNAKIVTGLGTIMLAGHEILMTIMSLSFCFGDGFGITASSLVGQNLGAKRPDLSIIYGKICQRMSVVTSTVLFLVLSIFGIDLVKIFTHDPEILKVSEIILIVIGIIIFAQASQMVFMGALRGAGDAKYTAIISLISIVIIRPLVSYVLAYPLGLGLIGAWLAIVVDQVLRLILTHQRFSSGKWTKIEI